MQLDIYDLPRELRGLPIIFFDLDNTLTDADTDVLWVTWKVKRDPLALPLYFSLMKLYNRYRRGLLTEQELIDFQVKRIGRRKPMRFKALCHRFFEEVGQFHIYPSARTLVEAHRQTGSRIVMITAQHDMIAAPFANYLAMDDLVGSRISADNDKFGDPILPFCYKEGKAYWAKEYAKSLGVELNQCALYSDSRNDLPLFEAVGFPIATNPDPTLETVAQGKDWFILKILPK